MFGSQSEIVYFSLYALTPAVLILYYVYSRDRFPESPRIVLITFILGAGTIFPISLLIPVFEGVIENFNLSVLGEDFYFSFVRAAFLEEASKWLVLIFFCVKSREFNEPMDAIVYGVAVSLGFAAYENWEYVRIALYESSDMASTVAWMRSFTAIPLHALAGIFMGFFLLSSIFEEENKKLNLFLSLFFPICLNGIYDLILISNNISAEFIYVLLVLMTIRAYFIFKNLRSKQNNAETEDELIGSELVTQDIFIILVTSLVIPAALSLII